MSEKEVRIINITIWLGGLILIVGTFVALFYLI